MRTRLGVTLELSEQGINGLIVRSLSKKGLLFKDGRIHLGDNLLSINHESLRNATTSKAKAVRLINIVYFIQIKYFIYLLFFHLKTGIQTCQYD